MSQGKGGGTKEGAYLGGVRCLETLKCRCHVDEDTGCWHWKLAIINGSPSVNFVLDGVRQKTRGRRAAVLLAGKKVRDGYTVYAKKTCQSDDCVNPDHAKIGPKGSENTEASKRGNWKDNPNKIKVLREHSKKKRKLTDDQAAQVRCSDKTHAELSKEYGISRFAIWSIKQGHSYKPKNDIFSLASLTNWRP